MAVASGGTAGTVVLGAAVGVGTAVVAGAGTLVGTALLAGAPLAGEEAFVPGSAAVRCAAEPHELAVITSAPPRATR